MNPAKSIFVAFCFVIIFIPVLCLAAPVYIPVSRVSGGEDHTLILTEANNVYGCGNNGYWQLGDGTQIDRIVPVQVHGVDDINFIENIITISAGWKHSLFLAANHRVLAVGNNQYGELGIENRDNQTIPVYVHDGEMNTASDFLENIICISAGRSGTHSLAADACGACWSFGNNDYGQLGNGEGGMYVFETTPVKVLGVNNDGNGLKNIIAVSGGEEHSMALEKIDPNDPNCKGRVYTFGDNTLVYYVDIYYPHIRGYGKLGINDDVNSMQTTPVRVHSADNNGFLQNIIAISAGWDHCMALEKIDAGDPNCRGRVYTWGNNGLCYDSNGGRLGNGTMNDACTPVLVLQGDMNTTSGYLENIIAISAGEGHCMALDANGCIWIWGDNKYGQLGNGTNDSCTVPVRVVGPDGNGFLSDINYISAGYWHSLAVNKSGKAYVWGLGEHGRLGTGSINNTNIPVPLELHDLNVYNQTQDNKLYKHIQPAIDEANSNDQIVVCEGYYCENIDFGTKAITLRSIDPNNWSVVDNTRIYSSSLSSVAIITVGNSGSEISGLTLTNGYDGISCNNANLIISHCRIENSSDSGIYCTNGSYATVTNSFINDNLYGIYSSYSSVVAKNNIIHHNKNYGIMLDIAQPSDVRNNTIVYNNSYGIYRSDGNDPNITSNIIWDNNSVSLGGTFTKVNYNCIQNYTGGGTGNISSDPCFVNKDVNDYHLKMNSNCIDKGDPCFNDANLFDIDGENRIMDGDSDGNARVDIGADEHWQFDMSPDGIVNFLDFAVFAGQWKKSSGDAGYNDRCDFYNDNVIDYKDLNIFCEYWLSASGWEDFGGEEMMMSMESQQEFSIAFEAEQESMQEDDGQSMMAGEGETASIYLICDVNEPNSGDEVTVQVYSDVSLFVMELGITVTGDANITGAMSTADCNEYGWDPSWPTDPIIDPTGWVYISGVKWDSDADGVVGYIKFRYNGGQVSVSITEGDAYDADCEPALFSGEALTFGPDPNES